MTKAAARVATWTTDQREFDVLDAQISRNQKRLNNAKQMRLDGEFDVTEYKEMKASIEHIINDLIRTS